MPTTVLTSFPSLWNGRIRLRPREYVDALTNTNYSAILRLVVRRDGGTEAQDGDENGKEKCESREGCMSACVSTHRGGGRGKEGMCRGKAAETRLLYFAPRRRVVRHVVAC